MNGFENRKMMFIYINESHKGILEEFFEEIHFYLYTVLRKAESVWSEKLKHKNTQIWPGTDCIFLLSLTEKELDEMLVKLKTFRASLPYEIVMAIGIIPLERNITDLLKENDVEIDNELLEKLKNKKKKK